VDDKHLACIQARSIQVILRSISMVHYLRPGDVADHESVHVAAIDPRDQF